MPLPDQWQHPHPVLGSAFSEMCCFIFRVLFFFENFGITLLHWSLGWKMKIGITIETFKNSTHDLIFLLLKQAVFIMGSRAWLFPYALCHIWPRQWVWECSGSKLEGNVWMVKCVCVYLAVKQYPEALQWSHWFTALTRCTPDTFYNRIPSLEGLAVGSAARLPQWQNTGGVRGHDITPRDK